MQQDFLAVFFVKYTPGKGLAEILFLILMPI
ncbi:hypothetical protein SAMN05444380_1268 [Thermophagus xiamenensis]|uniref:Uncharacterized protein n=1 Tax=Thermophagus xiamenensis TaxID=385682 RepID=A0A1I2F1Y5_9BACT|nr:hypothetical protein SAMN05444380_1268 [Thermophagus xiamenensis]